jgi:hypothetical protein
VHGQGHFIAESFQKLGCANTRSSSATDVGSDLDLTTGHPLTGSFSPNRLTAHGRLSSPAEAFVSRLGLTLDRKGGTQWQVHDAWW